MNARKLTTSALLLFAGLFASAGAMADPVPSVLYFTCPGFMEAQTQAMGDGLHCAVPGAHGRCNMGGNVKLNGQAYDLPISAYYDVSTNKFTATFDDNGLSSTDGSDRFKGAVITLTFSGEDASGTMVWRSGKFELVCQKKLQ